MQFVRVGQSPDSEDGVRVFSEGSSPIWSGGELRCSSPQILGSAALGTLVGNGWGVLSGKNSWLGAFILRATRGQQRSKSETISRQENEPFRILEA